ncbi:carboxypeptidase-like regulatory domain-containing protein [Aureibacter tunicatorum]|uniref:CarboxypepD_reg-like domain-containing protein n=1 Tax=Aureibacter tunicatorum TaxID=866807 RepID=A0AAE3XR05_9BACT|nr:carboxypeptidase-like regulatory domain-containing protein [Aureibacter tunicatorum]MDR6241547.1 hypothetical protein [Aureibacter tunicatorum]
MSDSEIIEYFSNSKNKTCGRFNSNQLRSYNEFQKPSRFKWLDLGVIGSLILSMFSIHEVQSQSKKYGVNPGISISKNRRADKIDNLDKKEDNAVMVITGRVIEESGEGAIGVNVVQKGSKTGTSTDFDGNFSLVVAKAKAKIVFNGIGYETQELIVSEENCENIIVTIESNAEILGEIVIMTGEVSSNKLYSSRKSIWQRIKNIF